jgi:hypothetical protein
MGGGGEAPHILTLNHATRSLSDKFYPLCSLAYGGEPPVASMNEKRYGIPLPV